jgi:hypothetical protein
MKGTILAVQMLIRLAWLVLIVLGLLFWTGHALNLILVHMDTGVVFVLLLWILAALAIFTRAALGLAILTVIWGLLVAAFGMAMPRLMAGGNPWPIGVAHLLIGIVAIGLAEMLSARMKRKQRTGAPA